MERATQDPHFVLVPWQGGISHIIPMTDIGRLLASHGAAVTIITTPANAPLVQSRVEDLATTTPLPPGAGAAGTITVTAVPFPAAEAGLPEGCERLDLLRSPADVPRFFAANRHFGEAVARYCRGSEAMLRRRPSCVVAGMGHSWTLGLARELGVPCYIFHGFGAFALLCIEYLYKHRPHEAVSSADELVNIPALPAFECRVSRGQLPLHFAPSTNIGGGTMQEIREFDVAVDGVVVNSFEELEHGSCELLAAATGKTVVAVGPVSLCRSPDLDPQAMTDDARRVMEWLDTKETRSVVYVSFGSAGCMPPAQVVQLGMALASCPWPVVWVVKGADSMPDDVKKWLRESFDSDKCLVVRGWAPQVAILAHRAVSGFLTHCGWGSTLEAPGPIGPPDRRHGRGHQAVPVPGRAGLHLHRRLRRRLLPLHQRVGAGALRPPLEHLLRRQPQRHLPPAVRRRVAGRRRHVPGARHPCGALQHAGARARQAQHPRRRRQAPAPHGDAAVRVPQCPRQGGARHGHLRARPRQVLRRQPGLRRRVQRRGVQEWRKWTAAYPFTKFYVGLPASPLAARSRFTDPGVVRRAVLPVAQKAANYGGVMLWDRYFDKRSNYSGSIKSWV